MISGLRVNLDDQKKWYTKKNPEIQKHNMYMHERVRGTAEADLSESQLHWLLRPLNM